MTLNQMPLILLLASTNRLIQVYENMLDSRDELLEAYEHAVVSLEEENEELRKKG